MAAGRALDLDSPLEADCGPHSCFRFYSFSARVTRYRNKGKFQFLLSKIVSIRFNRVWGGEIYTSARPKSNSTHRHRYLSYRKILSRSAIEVEEEQTILRRLNVSVQDALFVYGCEGLKQRTKVYLHIFRYHLSEELLNCVSLICIERLSTVSSPESPDAYSKAISPRPGLDIERL